MTAYAIEFKDLHKSFGKTEIIRGIQLAVETDQIHAIIGPNGAGKSTLYNLVTWKLRLRPMRAISKGALPVMSWPCRKMRPEVTG